MSQLVCLTRNTKTGGLPPSRILDGGSLVVGY